MIKCINKDLGVFFDEEKCRLIRTKDINIYLDNINLFNKQNNNIKNSAICRKLTTDLIIRVPNKCNLNCKYCSAESNCLDETIMDMSKVKKAIDYVVKNYKISKITYNNPKKVNITITGGGEPVVYWNYLVEIVDYLNSRHLENIDNISLRILTNAQISTDERRNWLLKNFDIIFISADGKSVQNIQRPRLDKNSSQDYIDKFMDILNKNKKYFGIRMTVTKESLVNIVDDIKYFFDNYVNLKYIQLQPVINMGRGKNIERIDIDEFIKKYNILKDLYEDKILNSFDFMDNNLSAPCSSLSGISFCILPNGSITACNMTYEGDGLWDELIVGSFDQNQKINIFKNAIDVNVSEKCKNCNVYRICHGGCIFKIRRDAYGEIIDEAGEYYCNLNKAIIENNLMRLLNKKAKVLFINNIKVEYVNI